MNEEHFNHVIMDVYLIRFSPWKALDVFKPEYDSTKMVEAETILRHEIENHQRISTSSNKIVQ